MDKDNSNLPKWNYSNLSLSLSLGPPPFTFSSLSLSLGLCDTFDFGWSLYGGLPKGVQPAKTIAAC